MNILPSIVCNARSAPKLIPDSLQESSQESSLHEPQDKAFYVHQGRFGQFCDTQVALLLVHGIKEYGKLRGMLACENARDFVMLVMLSGRGQQDEILTHAQRLDAQFRPS